MKYVWRPGSDFDEKQSCIPQSILHIFQFHSLQSPSFFSHNLWTFASHPELEVFDYNPVNEILKIYL